MSFIIKKFTVGSNALVAYNTKNLIILGYNRRAFPYCNDYNITSCKK